MRLHIKGHIVKKAVIAAVSAAAVIAGNAGAVYAGPAAPNVALNLFYGGAAHAYSHEALSVTVNNVAYNNSPLPALAFDDTAFISAQAGFSAAGAVYGYNKADGTYTITYQANVLAVRPDTKQAALNGGALTIDPPPIIVNNYLMVPLILTANVMGIPATVTDSRGTVFSAAAFDNYAQTHQTLQQAPPAPPGTPDAIDTGDTAGQTGQTGQTGQPAAAPPAAPAVSLADDQLFSLSNTSPLPVVLTDVSAQPLTIVNGPEAAVTGLAAVSDGQSASFVVTADAAITGVAKSQAGGSLVIDINNARNALPQSVYASPLPAVAEADCSQIKNSSANVTRLLFKMAGPASYSLALSPDRKTLTVSFLKDKLKNIGFRTSGGCDYIYIQTSGAASVSARSDNSGAYIDISDVGAAYPLDAAVNGAVITAYSLKQNAAGGVYIALTEKTPARADVNQKGNTAVIRFSPSGQPAGAPSALANIAYDAGSGRIAVKKDPARPVSLGAIIQTDNYTKLRYVFSFPGDCTPFLGGGTQALGGGALSSAGVQYNARTGRTDLTIGENNIYAYKLTEDSNNIYITPVNPKTVYPKIVIIDPGHGGSDIGASHGGVLEKDLSLAVCNKVIPLLDAGGIKAYMTRTDDSYPSLTDRVNMANALGDLFISVHINASPQGYGSAPNGTESFYDPHANDGKMGISTKQAAQILQNQVVAALGSKDDGIDSKSFQVTRTTNMPSALCELGFITNPAECAQLAADGYQQKAAQGVYNAVIQIFNTYKPVR